MMVVMKIPVGRDNKYVVDVAIHDGGYDKHVLVEKTSTWWICEYMMVVMKIRVG